MGGLWLAAGPLEQGAEKLRIGLLDPLEVRVTDRVEVAIETYSLETAVQRAVRVRRHRELESSGAKAFEGGDDVRKDLLPEVGFLVIRPQFVCRGVPCRRLGHSGQFEYPVEVVRPPAGVG